MQLTPDLALDLWYMARDRELGILIPVEPSVATQVQTALYRARTNSGDDSLNILSSHITPDGTELWLYKRPEAILE